MPDPLRSQFPLIEEFLRYSNIAAIRIANQEADDAMASLARQAQADAAEALLATSDKDSVPDGVRSRYRYLAHRDRRPHGRCRSTRENGGGVRIALLKLLALTAISVDNIPGVPGIGPKTAANLLADFGSLDGLVVASRWRCRRENPRCAGRSIAADVRTQCATHSLAHRSHRACVDWDAFRVRPPYSWHLRDFFTGFGTALPGA